MPGKVKVKIIAGRNLPVMDRSADTTDAYVEVKFGNMTVKTDVFRKSLNPEWNSEVFVFEVDDSELQDEPLQIRIMDHDTYSSNDAIGKVYVDLNPLLFAPTQPAQGRNLQDNANSSGAAVMSGWLPVYDTMHGIRGEVNIHVKVDLFSDFNKFRQSSCGVQFFFTAGIPTGFRCNSIIGFVEELVVNDDPEYQWIDKIRTPRASNEARQTLFSKLSGELQRRIGLKVLEQGGNAVIGYRQCFDLEGESGIVVRGIGSVVSLSRIIFDPSVGVSSSFVSSPYRECSQRDDPPSTELCRSSGLSPCTSAASPKRRSRKTSGNLSRSPQLHEPLVDVASAKTPSAVASNQSPTHSIKMASPSRSAGVYINRRSSDSELSITPKGGSLPGSGGSSSGRCGIQGGMGSPRPFMTQESFDNLIYPFLTMKTFPPGFIIHIGGTVCSRSVQLLDRSHTEEVETRDSWWSDLRTEIRSHARTLGCNAVLGYEEFTSISDEVCLLNAVGTAALINVRYQEIEASFSKMSVKSSQRDHSSDKRESEMASATGAKPKDPSQTQQQVNRSHPNMLEDTGESSGSGPGAIPKCSGVRIPSPCTICHSPFTDEGKPKKATAIKCACCRKANVPDIILATIELPSNLPIVGVGCLIQTRVIRSKRDLKGECNAREMSDAMPFLEYDLHKQLYTKLMIKGMNAIFGLRMRVTIGEKYIVGIGTGTGVYLKPLPPPTVPRIIARVAGNESQKEEMQRKVNEVFEKNKQFYGINNIGAEVSRVSRSESKGSDSEDSDDEDQDAPSSGSNKDMYDLDVNDQEDVEIWQLLLEDCPPNHLKAVSSTQIPPGMSADQFVNNLQMFSKVFRAKVTSIPNRVAFSANIDNILQGVYFKMRNLSPCIISGLHMSVDLPEDDEIQVSLYAVVLGIGAPPVPATASSKAVENAETKKTKQDDGELMFRMEEVSEELSPPVFKVKNSCSSFPSTTSFSSESSKSSFKMRTSNSPFAYHVPPRPDHYGVEITPLSFIPGASIEKYLGNLNFFFIRESTSIKENGGLSGFMGSFIAEVLALVRAHVAAIGGNAMISYFLSECVLLHSPHKNQGQCLINVGGDIVHVQYNSNPPKSEQSECPPGATALPLDQARGTTPTVFE